MNDHDHKLENRKNRLALMVATMFAATPQELRISQADVNGIVESAFMLERKVADRLKQEEQ